MNLTIDKRNWKKIRLDDVIEWYQKDIPNNEQVKHGVQFYVTANHIDGDSIKFDRYSNIDDGQKGPTITKHFKKGDLLLSTRSVALRKAAIAPIDGVTGEKLLVLRIKHNSELISQLFPFVFQSIDFWEFAQNSASGSVNKFTSWTKIREYEFLLPPKDQQAQLAELLWAMDEVIEREKEVLNHLKFSYLSVIEKSLIARDAQKIFFKDLVHVVRGVGYKPEQLLDGNDTQSCILLRSNNIFNGSLNYDGINLIPLNLVKSEQFLKEGDFAICMSNGSKELVGKCGEFTGENRKVTIGSFCAALRPKNNDNRRLVRHLVNSESYRVVIKRTLSGSAINNLKPSDIQNLFIRIDNNALRSNVLDNLDSLLNNMKSVEIKISSSKSLQKSLINQIF